MVTLAPCLMGLETELGSQTSHSYAFCSRPNELFSKLSGNLVPFLFAASRSWQYYYLLFRVYHGVPHHVLFIALLWVYHGVPHHVLFIALFWVYHGVPHHVLFIAIFWVYHGVPHHVLFIALLWVYHGVPHHVLFIVLFWVYHVLYSVYCCIWYRCPV